MQVTPLLGTLPPLLVLPAGKSPLEGWRFLPEDTSTSLGYQSQTFEGLYEWQFHTLAYAQNEWKNVTPWNPPSSATLQPGQTRTYGLRFVLAPSIRGIESALQTAKRPVAVGIPGYILPSDQPGKLFLSFSSAVSSISVSPAGALSWTRNTDAQTSAWVGYTITGHTWGRSRLTVMYADGTVQTVHYYVTHAAVQAIADLGNFLTTESWFDDPTDPFNRSPSVISYDREVNAVVKDDPRAWIPGLSDEAGAGSWLAASVKQFAQPNAAEVAKMEQFVNETLWGSIQNADGTWRPLIPKLMFMLYFCRLCEEGIVVLRFSILVTKARCRPSTSTNLRSCPTMITLHLSSGETGGRGTRQRPTRRTGLTTTCTSLRRTGLSTASRATTRVSSRRTRGSGTSTRPS